MVLDDGGVDHGVFHVWLVRAGLEQPDKNVDFYPVAVALEDSVPVAEKGRQVTPRAARPHDPLHRLDEAAIVTHATPGVRRFAQAMRRHLPKMPSSVSA
jgi:hypothetical protein